MTKGPGIEGLEVLATLAAGPFRFGGEPPQTVTSSPQQESSAGVASVAGQDGWANTTNMSPAERRKRRLNKIRARTISTTNPSATSSEDNESTSSEDAADAEAEAEARILDAREFKKQQRMIRNRQSAALSRKRKADRISSLEERVRTLEEENFALRTRLKRLSTVKCDAA